MNICELLTKSPRGKDELCFLHGVGEPRVGRALLIEMCRAAAAPQPAASGVCSVICP